MNSFDIVYSMLKIKGVGPKTLQKWTGCYWFTEGSGQKTVTANDIDVLVRMMAESSSRIDYPGEVVIRENLEKAAMVRKAHENIGIRATSWFCPDYPPRLNLLADPPPIIYTKGDMSLLEGEIVTMVGSRQPDNYTARSMYKIARRITGWDQVVLSGLAEGCDYQAHRGCLDASGLTIGVLAGGIDKVYPAKHRELAHEITVNGGLLVSTSELGTEPSDYLFVHRDRLQVQLSDRVICGIAKRNGGSLHACKAATELGKPLATVKALSNEPNSEIVNLEERYGASLLAHKEDLEVFCNFGK